MPPVLPPGSQQLQEHERAGRVRFRRAIALMLMTLLLPGSAQLVAGNRKVGIIALRVAFGCVAVTLVTLFLMWVAPFWTVQRVIDLSLLSPLRLLLIGLALGWAALFMDAWRLGQPLTLQRKQRLTVVGVNGTLCLSVAGTLLFASSVVSNSQTLLSMFADGDLAEAHNGRYNVLLLGGDSGAGRWGLRTDSMTVASIDEETGRTVLIGLPRNMQNFTFAEDSVMDQQFPDGFNCEGCYLNGVSTWALDHKDLFKDPENAAMEATISAIEGITDLSINYYVMVNLQGFRDVVDAVGGVEMTVRDRIPIGLPHDDFYSHIEPGTRKLNGYQTLWFARARDGSDDYSRMARQKCVMNALLEQVSPGDALRHYGDLVDATTGMIETNIPGKGLMKFVELANKAKNQKMASVSLVPPLINTADPDMAEIHAMVEKAIDKAEGKGGKPSHKVKVKATANGETQRGGSLGTRDTGYAANDTEDLSETC